MEKTFTILKDIMQKIFLFLSLILIIPDIYIYKMFITRLTVSPLWRCLYFVPSLLLFIGLIYIAFFAGNHLADEKSRWIGWFIVTYMLFAFPKLLFFACSLLDLPLKFLLKWNGMPFSYLGIALGIACAGIVLFGAIWGKTKFDVKEVVFRSPDIPKSFNGYKIIQLSDIHIGSWVGNEKAMAKAVDIINKQNADLVVFTGDLINHRAVELNGFENILSRIKAKDGVYSILGNHDYGPYYQWNSKQDQANNLIELKEREARMGWKLLNNEHVLIRHGNDSIALIGVENEGEPPFSQHGDLKGAMKGTENTAFKLLLSHNPTHWKREVLSTDIQLMLAGHTHAMQLAFGQHSPSSLVYPQWKGMYEQDGKYLYVNVGLGFVGMPFRFGAWPEITVITLQSE